MQNINNIVQNFLHKHKNDQRYLFVLILLSVMVIAIVCSSLITPAVSMTGELVCQKEQHTHSEDCYAETLICTEDTEGHQHSEDCYTTETKLVCGLEEDENHTHSDECYTTETVLNCDIPEKEPHTHTAECYERELICGKEEHTHTDECYKSPPAETESTKEAEEETQTDENPEETEKNEPEVIIIDPIDAERDTLLNSVKVKTFKSRNTYSVNGNVTVIDEISVDFGNFIKSVTHKEVAGASSQTNVKTVKFTINYNLPENTLMNNSTNRQIHCLLPDNVVITEEKSGIVRKEGQEIGTYKITDDGYIIIDFDQNFVKDGSASISGDISFNADVYKTDENSNYETVTIGRVSDNIPFLQETAPSNDLSVNKLYNGYDRSTKKVSYTVEIKSYNGSGDGNITVTDSFPSYINRSLIHLDWNDGDTAVFTKTASDGSTSEVSGTVSVADDGTVTITGLPALGTNESYSIDYTASLTPGTQDTLIKADNSISVSNGTLTDEKTCYAEAAVNCGITKEGKYNDRSDMVEWTISVTNPFGDALDGYSISDDMLGITVNGLKIKDSNGNIIETLDDSNNWSGTTGSLDKSTNTFSFSASSNGAKYTLVYETKLPDRSAIADNTVSNKAVLKNGDTEINAPQANASIWADRQYVNKSCRSSSYDASGNVIIDWLAKLEFQTGDFNGQTYNDTMTADSNYHYMTSQQKDALNLVGYKSDYSMVNLEKDTDYTIKWYDVNGNEIANDTDDIYSFEIVFADTDKISELCDIYIYYSAMGITENMTEGSERLFSNKAEFAGIESTAQYREYKKEPFSKFDCSISNQISSSNETYHNTNDLEKDENGNIILKWYIDVNESHYFLADTDAVMTDILPAGTVLNERSVRYGDWSTGNYSLVENSTMTYTISENENGQQIVEFTVPGSLHNGNKFRIDYSVTVSEEYMKQNKDARGRTSFKNTITDGIYTSEQTQVLERSLITKTGSDPSDSYDGYINYSIDVNPKAELLSNNGKITVSDKINYQYNAFVPTLVEVKIYSVETDSNGIEQLTELDPSKYNLSYANDGIDATFKVELPDKTHLKIHYRYHCVYKNPEWFEPNDNGVDIYNSAVLEFDSSSQNASYTDRYYLNNESAAHAIADDYLKIEKVDADNYGVKLSGAEFSLYKWDGTQWLVMTNITSADDGSKIPEWSAETTGGSEGEQTAAYNISTGSDGKAMLPEVEDGVLYKIVEANAPTDYIKSIIPHYFAENSCPTSLPSDVKTADVKVLLKGGIITITNEKMQKTEIEVQKFWHDPPGFSGIHDPVEVELFQSKKDPSGKIDGPEIIFNFHDNQDNHITRSFTVQRGADLVIDIRTFMSWYKSYPTIYLTKNGTTEEVNIFNNNVDGFSWNANANWSWFTERPDGWQYIEEDYSTYILGFSNVTTDMIWDITFDYAREISDYAVFIGNEEMGVPITGIPDDAVSVGTALLTNDNSWSYKWDNIPATDEFGYNYYYYVRENTTVTSYTPSYDNNGANNGIIYITNRGEGYTNEMPETGGTGNKHIIIIGVILISGSSAFYLLSKRRRRRKERFKSRC
ncbi:SpaA isopeptide-forming pilin-related protein [Porcipelethomonas sp.]|uniref:SpaA isopeptide-forming pilin-related protein n=1 Tax=Porcipelethomonas sp. TaxID=2981675 RepID=UPI003EF73277